MVSKNWVKNYCIVLGSTVGSDLELLGIEVLSIRPHFSELIRDHLIEKTAERRKSSRVRPQMFWTIAEGGK